MTKKPPAPTRRRVAGLTDEEWRVTRTARANVLLVGRDTSATRIIEALRPHLSPPIYFWCLGTRLVLPPAEHAGTLFLLNLGAMGREDQGWLMRLVADHGWANACS
jgi:hypothetical protein